jgi:hypothetical protein
MLTRITGLLRAGAMAALASLAAVAAYSYTKGNIAADIYRDRLRQLSDSYQDLHRQYNDVVKKTAVTELVLSGGRLSVVVRTADGVLETIPTELDPNQEVHVEYVARDGRLWIRRVYTLTEPDPAGKARAEVALINPSLADLPWTKDPNLQGLSVYRKELTPGRWVVTTTGNAALALTKLPPGQSSDLSAPPAVRDYGRIEQEVRSRLDELSVSDVVQRMIDGEK